ncbi:MAG: polysulfide reductase NrfD [Coriobacteriia bacterium]|nr:polysulfide reductase NrfD [Coriobacteriia bacterium]
MTETTAHKPGVKRFIGIDWDLGALRSASPRFWLWVAFLGTFVVVGVAAWGAFITQGGVVMAQRDGSPWGLWFTNYMYYVGLAAGGLVVYASVHLFGAEQYRPLSRIAVLQAGVFTMLALLGVVSDFEQPIRLLNMVISPNPTAPFVYTGTAAGLYMVLCFVDLWIMLTGTGGEKLAFTMTLIALPAAIYLHTTTAFVLALNKSRELWHSAVMVPIFLTSATASGIAVLFIFAYIFMRVTNVRFKPSMFRSLATLLATVIIIDLFLLSVEVLWTFWPTSAIPGETSRLIEFVAGRYAPFFLPIFVLGFTAFGLLANRKLRHLPAIQITASILYIIAIFLKRYSLMAMGFSLTPLGQPTKIYFPSLVETGIALGILAFGILFVTICVKIMPLEVPKEELEAHHGHGHASLDEAEVAA